MPIKYCKARLSVILLSVSLILGACAGVDSGTSGASSRVYDAQFEKVINATGSIVDDLRLNIRSSTEEDAITYVIVATEDVRVSGNVRSDAGQAVTVSTVTIRIRRESLSEKKPVRVTIESSSQNSDGGAGLGGASSTSSSRTDFAQRITNRLDRQFDVVKEKEQEEEAAEYTEESR